MVDKKIESLKDYNGNPASFEDILERLGGFGRFQAFFLFFILILEMPAAMVAFVPIFVGEKKKSNAELFRKVFMLFL